MASSGIDYDIKLWMPLEENPHFEEEIAAEVSFIRYVMITRRFKIKWYKLEFLSFFLFFLHTWCFGIYIIFSYLITIFPWIFFFNISYFLILIKMILFLFTCINHNVQFWINVWTILIIFFYDKDSWFIWPKSIYVL